MAIYSRQRVACGYVNNDQTNFMKILILIMWMAVNVQSNAIALESKDTVDWNQKISVEDLQTDLKQLYMGLKNAHPDLYIHRSKSEYDAFYLQTLQQIDRPKSRFDTQVLFQKFTAFGNVAHSNIAFPEEAYSNFRLADGRIFPIYLRIVKGQSYVGQNYSDNQSIMPGDEILELNGVLMSEWLARAGTNVSADTPYIANSLLEFTFPRYLWLELGELDSYAVLLRTGTDEPRLLNVSSRTQKQMKASAINLPEVFTLSSSERISKMLVPKIAYLRPGPFYNIEDSSSIWDNSGFISFVDDAFETFIENQAKALIVDLRMNPGGDNSFSDYMLAWFADRPFRFVSKFLIKSSNEAAASNQARLNAQPNAVESVSFAFAQQYAKVPRGELFNFDIPYVQPRAEPKFHGKVYVLINRHSYSNAVNVAAIIQDYGFGTIVGEKTSDMATTYGAMETFKLIKTDISVNFPKAHIIRPSGDKKSDGVTPDEIISSPVISHQDDVVLKTLLVRLTSGSNI